MPPFYIFFSQVDRTEIEINENIIGAVIGPSGRHVVDIQQFSGARVQVSWMMIVLSCAICRHRWGRRLTCLTPPEEVQNSACSKKLIFLLENGIKMHQKVHFVGFGAKI